MKNTYTMRTASLSIHSRYARQHKPYEKYIYNAHCIAQCTVYTQGMQDNAQSALFSIFSPNASLPLLEVQSCKYKYELEQIQIRIGTRLMIVEGKVQKKIPNISILIFWYFTFHVCVFANVTIKYICFRFWTTRLRSTLASDDLTIVQQTMQLYSFICSLVTLPGLLHSKYNYIAMNREWYSLWIFVGEFGFWFFRQQIFFSLCCDCSLALNRIWKSFSKSKCHT